MDIHNYKGRFERTVQRIQDSNDIFDDNKKIALEFKDYLLSENIGVAKISRYLGDLIKFSKMLSKSFSDATEKDLRKIIGELNQTNLSEGTKKTFKIMLRKLYRFIRGVTKKGQYPPEVEWISIAISSNHKKLPEELLTEEEIMFSLKKSYSALLEILWAKLKRIIFLAELNPKEKHLSLPGMGEKLKELEKSFSVDLHLIKNILKGELRNCVNHEKTYFEHPNFLVFMEEVKGKWEEIYRINDINLIEELLKIFTILTAFHHVETAVIVSQLEPLLKLNDEELEEYCKTGILTEEMQKKIEKYKIS